jgi:hypothetical protein
MESRGSFAPGRAEAPAQVIGARRRDTSRGSLQESGPGVAEGWSLSGHDASLPGDFLQWKLGLGGESCSDSVNCLVRDDLMLALVRLGGRFWFFLPSK